MFLVACRDSSNCFIIIIIIIIIIIKNIVIYVTVCYYEDQSIQKNYIIEGAQISAL